jgi:hypothetical protein
VIPVIIGATGTMPKSFIKYLSNLLEKYRIKEQQKTVILGTSHILQKALIVRVEDIFNKQNNITRGTNCKYRTAVILYIY